MSVETLQKIYILHTRPYRDTSLLVDALSEEEGLISFVARGAKRPKSPLKAVLMMFTPILASWYGRGDLKTLKTAELSQVPNFLRGHKLLSAFYLHEILLRLLQRYDPYPHIFHLYAEMLTSNLGEPELRYFEKSLLESLGYGLQLQFDAALHKPIVQDTYYDFEVGHGFTAVLTGAEIERRQQKLFKGDRLLAIAINDYQDAQVRKDAKRLFRQALSPLLGDRPLEARNLFVKSFAKNTDKKS